jgi:hypothetical protein
LAPFEHDALLPFLGVASCLETRRLTKAGSG